MKNAYFRLPVNLTGPVKISIYETPVNLVLTIALLWYNLFFLYICFNILVFFCANYNYSISWKTSKN